MMGYNMPQTFGYGHPAPAAPAMGGGFALIVVLFILLVIVGSAYVK